MTLAEKDLQVEAIHAVNGGLRMGCADMQLQRHRKDLRRSEKALLAGQHLETRVGSMN